MRLVGIFLAAGSVLVGSLAVLTLAETRISTESRYAWGSVVAAIVLAGFFYPVTPQAYAPARDPAKTTSLGVVALGLTQGSVSAFLLVGNLVHWQVAWPLLAAFSIQLSWGLYLFARVLTLR